MTKFLLLLAFFIVFSCAQKQILIQHNKIGTIPQLEKMKPFTRVSGSLNVLDFVDNRSNRSAVGEAASGITNTFVPLVLDVSTEEYFKYRLQAGLTSRGVEVVGRSKYAIRGVIRKLWVWENADGYTFPEMSSCEVIADFDIISTKDNMVIYRGNVNSKASGTSTPFDTTDSDGPVLNYCMEHIAEQIVANKDLANFIQLN